MDRPGFGRKNVDGPGIVIASIVHSQESEHKGSSTPSKNVDPHQWRIDEDTIAKSGRLDSFRSECQANGVFAGRQ